jgi:PAS domain-containing protein
MIDCNENALSTGIVAVVDDDESVRESLPDLLKELGFAARAFSSAKQFLAAEGLDQTPCLIPTSPCRELQRENAERQRAEEGLRRSEEYFRRSKEFLKEAQRLSSTGGFAWRVAKDEIRWSEQLYRIFEFDPAAPVTLELIGSRVHPESPRPTRGRGE